MYANIWYNIPSLTEKVYMLHVAGYKNKINIMLLVI